MNYSYVEISRSQRSREENCSIVASVRFIEEDYKLIKSVIILDSAIASGRDTIGAYLRRAFQYYIQHYKDGNPPYPLAVCENKEGGKPTKRSLSGKFSWRVNTYWLGDLELTQGFLRAWLFGLTNYLISLGQSCECCVSSYEKGKLGEWSKPLEEKRKKAPLMM